MKRSILLFVALVILTFAQTAQALITSAVISADSEESYAPIDELMATGLFQSVDWINAGPGWNSGATPTWNDIKDYDSLLVYSNLTFDDRDSLSNVLRQYVDAGGHVVLAALDFTDNTSSYFAYSIGSVGSESGILAAGYSPFKPVYHENTNPTDDTLYALSPGDAIFDGISIDGNDLLYDFGYYNDEKFVDPVLDTSADLLAACGNGTKMIARNEMKNVVALNLLPTVDAFNTGEFYELVANAMQPVPEPGISMLLALAGLALVYVIRR